MQSAGQMCDKNSTIVASVTESAILSYSLVPNAVVDATKQQRSFLSTMRPSWHLTDDVTANNRPVSPIYRRVRELEKAALGCRHNFSTPDTDEALTTLAAF